MKKFNLKRENFIIVLIRDGVGSKFFDLGWIGLIFCCSGWVSHLWFGPEFRKFPLKIPNCTPSGRKTFFRFGQKVPGSKTGLPLIYCWSKVSLDRVKSGPISSLNSEEMQNPSQVFYKLHLSGLEKNPYLCSQTKFHYIIVSTYFA